MEKGFESDHYLFEPCTFQIESQQIGSELPNDVAVLQNMMAFLSEFHPEKKSRLKKLYVSDIPLMLWFGVAVFSLIMYHISKRHVMICSLICIAPLFGNSVLEWTLTWMAAVVMRIA